MRYREHRGGLAESLATTVKVDGFAGILAHEQAKEFPWPDLSLEAISAHPYGGDDDRCGWKDVHIVCLEGEPIGFCEGMPR